MWSVGGVDVESESVGSGVDVALEPKRGRRIESLSRGHSNHRRASLIERANGIVEDGNKLTDREPYGNAGRYGKAMDGLSWLYWRCWLALSSQPHRGKQ